MTKFSKAVKASAKDKVLRKSEVVKNFMNGDSYKYDPLTTLKMISASSIFGEPSFYNDGMDKPSYSSQYSIHSLIADESVIPSKYENMTTDKIMTQAIDDALNYDYIGTLDWAVVCRNKYNMRLNPQIIMVRAALHPSRKKYTKKNTFDFHGYNSKVMLRADEPMVQMAYYLYLKGNKNNIPSILKRSWAKKLSTLSAYEVNKYKNAEIGMINGVRICHAHSQVIDELMQSGAIKLDTSRKTWEQLRSDGNSWEYILNHANMGHMAMLRNIRGVFTEINDINVAKQYVEKLKDGVANGKQFPFRYYSAYNAVKNSDVNFKSLLLDGIAECLELSISNMPKLKGTTICLSDNSGSAWGSIPTEYGSVTVAEIDNLSAIITAKCADDGYIGIFGDRLQIMPVTKSTNVLEMMDKVREVGRNIGRGTEGGIWVFFNGAMNHKKHYDNIFIYSDQQAGTGGLYGTSVHFEEYRDKYKAQGNFINVFKILLDYRANVNPKVNVFSVQTAGYSNAVLPQKAYRTDLLYGWTGKENIFADCMIKLWDDYDFNLWVKSKGKHLSDCMIELQNERDKNKSSGKNRNK